MNGKPFAVLKISGRVAGHSLRLFHREDPFSEMSVCLSHSIITTVITTIIEKILNKKTSKKSDPFRSCVIFLFWFDWLIDWSIFVLGYYSDSIWLIDWLVDPFLFWVIVLIRLIDWLIDWLILWSVMNAIDLLPYDNVIAVAWKNRRRWHIRAWWRSTSPPPFLWFYGTIPHLCRWNSPRIARIFPRTGSPADPSWHWLASQPCSQVTWRNRRNFSQWRSPCPLLSAPSTPE